MWIYLHSFSCCCLPNMPAGANQNSDKIWTYSRSRSSKVDDFGTNRKRKCDFLLVINSNFGTILHRFWDTATYWLKIAHFSYPSLIRCPHSISSLWNFMAKLSVKKLESWGCSVMKVAWSYLQPSSTDAPVWQTDGQMDGHICCRALKIQYTCSITVTVSSQLLVHYSHHRCHSCLSVVYTTKVVFKNTLRQLILLLFLKRQYDLIISNAVRVFKVKNMLIFWNWYGWKFDFSVLLESVF